LEEKIMKKFVKIISLVMALLMITAAFAACGKKDENKDDPKESVAQSTNDTVSSSEGTTKVPDIVVKNWEGREYRILGRLNTTYAWANSFEVSREEMPEDVVGKAVWKRNNDIRDNYGIEVKGIFSDNQNSDADTALASGEDRYDLLLTPPERYLPNAQKGYLYDIAKLDYINFDHEAWIDFINDQLMIGGRLYYTSNKFMLQDKNRSYMLFYNRDIAKELKLGHFEDLVFSNEWTIDKVIELGKKATYENDGQPGMTKNDQWGVGVAQHYSFSQFAMGAGFRFADAGSDGYPKLIGATDEMMRILDKVYSLTTNKEVYWCDEDYGSVDWNDCADHMFYNEKMMIFGCVISLLDDLGVKSDFEFGVLPNPKFDSNQEHYHATPNLYNGSLLGVPSTVADREFVGYALELISEKSVDTTYKAFIETKCKLQEVEDEDAAKCLDIIFNGMVYDLGFVNNIGGLSTLLTTTMGGASSNNYARLIGRYSTNAEYMLEKLKSDFAKIDY
jgi:ABC-type glycerol-3-phosphate transport system substrate-binding protein